MNTRNTHPFLRSVEEPSTRPKPETSSSHPIPSAFPVFSQVPFISSSSLPLPFHFPLPHSQIPEVGCVKWRRMDGLGNFDVTNICVRLYVFSQCQTRAERSCDLTWDRDWDLNFCFVQFPWASIQFPGPRTSIRRTQTLNRSSTFAFPPSAFPFALCLRRCCRC